jgi:hypothetical protein
MGGARWGGNGVGGRAYSLQHGRDVFSSAGLPWNVRHTECANGLQAHSCASTGWKK